jgi:DNA-directed RNA polymerase specialized sigma24 family protein
MSYDPDKGAKFSTYFWTSAKRRFLDLHKAASTQKRVGDYQRISMSQEDVQAVVEAAWDAPSAEDEAMALINVREIYRSGRTPL